MSLVPSLTEAIAASAPETLAGVTDWCSHPIDLDTVRVGGTKNPDVAAIISLAPDLVIANAEENRADDVDALRSAGQQVWVTDIRTVEQALTSMARLLEAIDAPSRSWLDDARSRWDGLPEPAAAERRRAVITIWRRPGVVRPDSVRAHRWAFAHLVRTSDGSGTGDPGQPARVGNARWRTAPLKLAARELRLARTVLEVRN